MGRPWRWIGHVMRGKPGNICCTALLWMPEGKQKRGWPKNTWHRTVEGELKTLHHTWGTIQELAQNRQEWGTFVAASHASRHEWVSESWGLDIQQTPLCVCVLGGGEGGNEYYLTSHIVDLIPWSPQPHISFWTNCHWHKLGKIKGQLLEQGALEWIG